MLPVNYHIWELTKFSQEFILVMFVMLMHDRFLAKFTGRHFRQSIMESEVLPQLLTIMSDTRAFRFFSRADILRMLTFHGSTQKFLETLGDEQTFCKFCDFMSLYNAFLTSLYTNPRLLSIIEGISYFRLTNCEDCHKYLDSDNDDGLCPNCESYRRLYNYEEELE
jgi:hypothetical protein